MNVLQELLQNRARLISNQRELLNKVKEEERGFTEEEDATFEDLDQQIHALDKQIEREKKVAAREADLNQPANEPYRPGANANRTIPGPAPVDKKDDGGFKNLGEFVNAVRYGDPKGRLEAMRNEQSMGDGPSGGFAVPEQFREEILRLNAEAAVVRPKASVIPAGDPPDSKITMPAFHQGAKGVYGGVEVQWIGEGDTKPETGFKLKEVTLEPHEVAGHVVVTDKLLRNWTSASPFIRNLLSQAMTAAEDLAFLNGDGKGKPNGVSGGTGALTVNRQAANEINYLDAVNMLAKLLPGSVGSAVWVATHSALPQITTMQDPNGNYIFIQGDATKGIPSTLAGIPIRFTGKTSPLGQMGDLQLLDLSYYLIKDGSGPFIAASEHVHFKQNKTVIKCFWNVDGKPWVDEPLTLEDGVTKVSPYVVLDVPAVEG